MQKRIRELNGNNSRRKDSKQEEEDHRNWEEEEIEADKLLSRASDITEPVDRVV